MDNINEKHRLIFETVAKAGELCGQQVYVIGGYVRDYYLCRIREAAADMDFVTLGSGIALAQKVADLLNTKDVAIFKNFGTAHVRFDSFDLEFVGARKESYERGSRKPIVENGTLEDDQLRRDFTINALSWSLNKDDFGKLCDPFGGLADLEARLIRTPVDPDITFNDDPLRMMRAIRFATQLGFDIVDETFESIKRSAKRIEIISQERISDELNKIIQSPIPSVGFAHLFKTGLLEIIFPELYNLHGVEEINGIRHKDNFWHTLQVLDNVASESENLWLRWAAILHDIAKPATKRFVPSVGWTFHGHDALGVRYTKNIFRRFTLPLDERLRYVQKLVKLHLRPIALVDEIVTDSAIRRLIVEAGDDLDDLMKLCRADITSKNESKVRQYLTNFDFVEQKINEVAEKDRLRNWKPPISGDEIMNTLKLKPGPEVGTIKKAIEEAIMEGEIPNEYQAAYNYMLKIYDQKTAKDKN
ncbi:MAG: HD domain-containing protein [Balneolales bacterium]